MRIIALDNSAVVIEIEDEDREISIKHPDFMYPRIFISRTRDPKHPLMIKIYEHLDGRVDLVKQDAI